jgi:hypothetical protein
MTDLVEKALKLAAEKEAAYPSALVDRALDSSNDLGNLLSWSENELDIDKLTSQNEDEREQYLLEMARDNAQVNSFTSFIHIQTRVVQKTIANQCRHFVLFSPKVDYTLSRLSSQSHHFISLNCCTQGNYFCRVASSSVSCFDSQVSPQWFRQ